MCAAGGVCGFLLQLFLEWLEKNVKDIKMQAPGCTHQRSQFVLDKSRENDRLCGTLVCCRVYFADCFQCLVMTIYKWQSHLPKMLAVKLRQQAVTQSFCRYASLVRQKEYGALSHMTSFYQSGTSRRGLYSAWVPVDCPFPHQ
jgi:hypothetical protein